LAWESETDNSFKEIEFPFIRPRVIASSRTMCSTDGKPGSWIVSVGMFPVKTSLQPTEMPVYRNPYNSTERPEQRPHFLVHRDSSASVWEISSRSKAR